MIVDDEEGPRQSIRAVFKEHYNVLMADNGLKAIELARDSNIDVAVLDIRMVGMSGGRPFLVPTAIDETPTSAAANVPERFLDFHWQRLPGGQVTDAFLEVIQEKIRYFRSRRERPL